MFQERLGQVSAKEELPSFPLPGLTEMGLFDLLAMVITLFPLLSSKKMGRMDPATVVIQSKLTALPTSTTQRERAMEYVCYNWNL
jgi:hypothetical protein